MTKNADPGQDQQLVRKRLSVVDRGTSLSTGDIDSIMSEISVNSHFTIPIHVPVMNPHEMFFKCPSDVPLHAAARAISGVLSLPADHVRN
jgi:hypothetical protein